MILTDRNMYWDANEATGILSIVMSVYSQLLCWRSLTMSLLHTKECKTQIQRLPQKTLQDIPIEVLAQVTMETTMHSCRAFIRYHHLRRCQTSACQNAAFARPLQVQVILEPHWFCRRFVKRHHCVQLNCWEPLPPASPQMLIRSQYSD
jgi:hypothetical protein